MNDEPYYEIGRESHDIDSRLAAAGVGGSFGLVGGTVIEWYVKNPGISDFRQNEPVASSETVRSETNATTEGIEADPAIEPISVTTVVATGLICAVVSAAVVEVKRRAVS